MAMLTTFIAWQLMHGGMPIWAAFTVTIAIAFVGAILLERTVIRPIEGAPALTIVIVTLGLLIVFNGIAGWTWGYVLKSFRSPFPSTPISIGGVALSAQDLGVIVVSLGTLTLMYLLFEHTKLGLALRAASLYPQQSRLMGIRVSWMLALGWGLAAVVGAISGFMVAPVVFLDPNMMQGILVYAFAAAVLGGIESPVGAVAGGLVLGVLLALLGTYVDFVGTDLRLPVAFAIIVIVLLFRPAV
jgi:branched-chain amino acid transport system permease protein